MYKSQSSSNNISNSSNNNSINSRKRKRVKRISSNNDNGNSIEDEHRKSNKRTLPLTQTNLIMNNKKFENTKSPNVILPGSFPVTPAPPPPIHLHSNRDHVLNNSIPQNQLRYNKPQELNDIYKDFSLLFEQQSKKEIEQDERINKLENQVRFLTDKLEEKNAEDLSYNSLANLTSVPIHSTPIANNSKKISEVSSSNNDFNKNNDNKDKPMSLDMNQFLSEIKSVKLRKVGLPSKSKEVSNIDDVDNLRHSWHGHSHNENKYPKFLPSPPTTTSTYSNRNYERNYKSLYDELSNL